jgi:hypothetical protein
VSSFAGFDIKNGRYLFYNGGSNDNYWVDAAVIKELRRATGE